ncbi:MAG: peroxide stress protein YaaA [Flavobacteriales bacterium]|nr:peroxide stress protein YaaA [Flavobacteriales bacterium]
MKILISPAKKLDFSREKTFLENSTSVFSEKSKIIMKELSSYSDLQLSKLMKISSNLGILNKERNDNWKFPFPKNESKQALLSFKGEVYQNMRIDKFNKSDFDFANNRLRILSGLYGILKPSDLILPYRLEMGTKLKIGDDSNLYDFWRESVTGQLLNEIKEDKFLVNLASEEYFKVINKKQIPIPIVTPIFKDVKNGKAKVVSFYAKRARGEMCNYIIKNKISSIDKIKRFDNLNYIFTEENNGNLVFTRDHN